MYKPADPVRHWTGVLAAAIPFFLLSWTLLRVWREPMSIQNGSWVPYGAGLLAIEFIVLHSGAFIGLAIASKELSFSKRLKVVSFFFVFYALMAWGMSMATGSLALFWLFVFITAGRVTAMFTAMPDNAREIMMRRIGLGTTVYLLVVFGTVMVDVPEYGITSSVLADVYPNRGSGLWEKDPERAIAGGVVYFFLQGMIEIVVFGLMKPPPPKPKPRPWER